MQFQSSQYPTVTACVTYLDNAKKSCFKLLCLLEMFVYLDSSDIAGCTTTTKLFRVSTLRKEFPRTIALSTFSSSNACVTQAQLSILILSLITSRTFLFKNTVWFLTKNRSLQNCLIVLCVSCMYEKINYPVSKSKYLSHSNVTLNWYETVLICPLFIPSIQSRFLCTWAT